MNTHTPVTPCDPAPEGFILALIDPSPFGIAHGPLGWLHGRTAWARYDRDGYAYVMPLNSRGDWNAVLYRVHPSVLTPVSTA